MSSSLGLLALPFLPQFRDIESTPLRPRHNAPRLPHDRHIDHLPIQGPGASTFPTRLLVCDQHSHRPLDLRLRRRERPLHHLHLTGVDTLLPIESHAPALLALLGQRLQALVPAEGGAHEVDGGGQVGGVRGRHDGAARVQELGERGRARQGQVEREVLGGEDEAAEVGRGAADLAEVHDGLGALDQRDDLHGVVVAALAVLRSVWAVARGQLVPQHVGDEGEVRGAVDLGHDDGVDVSRLEDGDQVGEGEARGNGVDAYGELGDVGRGPRGRREEGEEGLPGGGLLRGRHGVFEVVGDGVEGWEGQGLLEELGGGCWDCRGGRC